MSIRAYRLLRNNKEEGPFTAEEIIQKNLKPYDLIWIDGRSAAWSYPGELAEFKSYVPISTEASSTLYSNKETKPISSSVQAAIAMNDNLIQQEIKQPKPRYKVSAAWSKIQTVTAPAYNEVLVAEPKKISSKKIIETTQPATAESKSLSWKEAWLDWEKEKTAPVAEIVKTKSASIKPSKTINENYDAPVLETKYKQSLDSIKDKYIDSILQQKQKPKKSFSFGKASEFVIPSLALIIIFSVGYWLLHTTNETAAALSPTTVKTQPAKSENTNTLPANTNNNAATNEVAQNSSSNTQDVTSGNQQVLSDQAEDRKTNIAHAAKFAASKQNNSISQQDKFPATQIMLPDTKSTTQKTSNNTAKQFDPSVINKVPTDNFYNDPSQASTGDLNAQDARPTKRRTNAGDITDNLSAQKNQSSTLPVKSNKKSSTTYVNVPEYVEMNNGSADLKINNVSDVNLDLVVVDVQYFDALGRFRKGETLYLHNLRAGKNVVVKTPRDVNAQYATSKVSLVSSDANDVYVIGDN
jgi:hypothetical protein